MEYDPYDSSGTDDDLPPTHQNRDARGARLTGNGRTAIGVLPFSRGQNEMETEIHRLEREAYTSVLRAFKAQSDAISWEKESLITELRKELRVSDEEHRELLSKVNADDIIRLIREWRQAGGLQSSLLHNTQVAHDTGSSPTVSASHKRKKPSHPLPTLTSLSVGARSPGLQSQPVARGISAGTKGKKPITYTPTAPSKRDQIPNRGSSGVLAITESAEAPTSLIGRKVMTRWPDDNNFYEAVITDYDARQGLHALVYDMGTNSETWEWINLKEISPEDIRWEGGDPVILNTEGWAAPGPASNKLTGHNGAMPGAGRGRGRFLKNHSKKDHVPLPNGSGKKGFDHIEIPNTEIVIKEVEKVLNNQDIYEIEKAKKLLKDHEQSLLDAIAKLAEVSDGESGEGEGHEGFHGERMAVNGRVQGYR